MGVTREPSFELGIPNADGVFLFVDEVVRVEPLWPISEESTELGEIKAVFDSQLPVDGVCGAHTVSVVDIYDVEVIGEPCFGTDDPLSKRISAGKPGPSRVWQGSGNRFSGPSHHICVGEITQGEPRRVDDLVDLTLRYVDRKSRIGIHDVESDARVWEVLYVHWQH
jgi:hypothetical protein